MFLIILLFQVHVLFLNLLILKINNRIFFWLLLLHLLITLLLLINLHIFYLHLTFIILFFLILLSFFHDFIFLFLTWLSFFNISWFVHHFNGLLHAFYFIPYFSTFLLIFLFIIFHLITQLLCLLIINPFQGFRFHGFIHLLLNSFVLQFLIIRAFNQEVMFLHWQA